MKLYNTLSRTKEDFKPIEPGRVKLYACGPTVYDNLQIGNWRNQVFNDTLYRVLRKTGLTINRVMNITDVGHLVSDTDEGEDKLEKGAKRDGKSVWEVAEHYTNAYYRGAKHLNIELPQKIVKATDAINSQIELIKLLFEKGYAYKASQAIYFNTLKLNDYGKLSAQKLDDKETGARREVVTDPEKHHPSDFALWFFTVGHFKNHEMRWPSPWGEGFPGWHVECSAIIHQCLKEPIDIHTGGIDHIGTHHTNEIAQSEAAYEKPLANYWVHNEFLLIDGRRMGKSQGNFYTLNDVLDKHFDLLALRTLYLQSHYRTQQNFTWEALDAAQNYLRSLYVWADLAHQEQGTDQDDRYHTFVEKMEDDLNTPEALAILSEIVKAAPSIKLLKNIDDYLGLGLSTRPDIEPKQKKLIQHRQQARTQKDYGTSDKLRKQLLEQGIELDDTATGTRWFRTMTS